jgi:hypothetical protein
MIAHEQGNAVARLQTGRIKMTREAGTTGRPLGMSRGDLRAAENGGPVRVHSGNSQQKIRQIQSVVSGAVLCGNDKGKCANMPALPFMAVQSRGLAEN